MVFPLVPIVAGAVVGWAMNEMTSGSEGAGETDEEAQARYDKALEAYQTASAEARAAWAGFQTQGEETDDRLTEVTKELLGDEGQSVSVSNE